MLQSACELFAAFLAGSSHRPIAHSRAILTCSLCSSPFLSRGSWLVVCCLSALTLFSLFLSLLLVGCLALGSEAAGRAQEPTEERESYLTRDRCEGQSRARLRAPREGGRVPQKSCWSLAWFTSTSSTDLRAFSSVAKSLGLRALSSSTGSELSRCRSLVMTWTVCPSSASCGRAVADYRQKCAVDGTLLRHKARLCADV